MPSYIRGDNNFDTAKNGPISGTAVASTSGTSIDFTGIPSWAKRITVMFNGVSTNGSSTILIQLGSTTFTTSGYTCRASATNGTGSSFTTGFGQAGSSVASDAYSGNSVITLLTGNTWTQTSNQSISLVHVGAGVVTLSGTLDRVRITTVNGTDTFDAGSINIMYE